MPIHHVAVRGMLVLAAIATVTGCNGGSSAGLAPRVIVPNQASPTPSPTPAGSSTSSTQTFPVTTSSTTENLAPIGNFAAVSVMLPGATQAGGTLTVTESTQQPSFITVAPSVAHRFSRISSSNTRAAKGASLTPPPALYFLTLTPQNLVVSPISFVALPGFALTPTTSNPFALGSYEVEATYGSTGVWADIGLADFNGTALIFAMDTGSSPISLANGQSVTLALVGPIASVATPMPTPIPTPPPASTSLTITLPGQAGMAVAFPAPPGASANNYTAGSITFPSSTPSVNGTISINLSNGVPANFPTLPGGSASTPVLAATLVSSTNISAAQLAQFPAASVTLASFAPAPVGFPNPAGSSGSPLPNVTGYCVAFGSSAVSAWIPVGAAEGSAQTYVYPGVPNTSGQGLIAGITYGIILYADSNTFGSVGLDPTATTCN